MSVYSAVVFDLDGTLVDSSPDIAAALNTVLTQYGGRELLASEVVGLLGEGSRRLVAEATHMSGATPDCDLTTLNRQYLRAYKAEPATLSTVYPNVEEALRALRSAGVALGVCTNKTQELADIVLAEIGLAEFFSVVVGADAVPDSKPAPGHLFAAFTGLDADLQTALYVGDSIIDEATAKAASIEFLATAWAPAEITARRFDYAELAGIVLAA